MPISTPTDRSHLPDCRRANQHSSRSILELIGGVDSVAGWVNKRGKTLDQIGGSKGQAEDRPVGSIPIPQCRGYSVGAWLANGTCRGRCPWDQAERVIGSGSARGGDEEMGALIGMCQYFLRLSFQCVVAFSVRVGT